MAKFLNYLPQEISIEEWFTFTSNKLGVAERQQQEIMAFLAPLKVKDRATHDHSIRVGLTAQQIGAFIHLDRKALWYAGLLHDVGKAQTRLSTLQKTDGWSEADTQEIMGHVMDGYRLIRDKFDFSAEIILWHHRFQARGYPKELPPSLHDYCEGTKVMIPWYGRMLSLADTFDALHRVNDKHGDQPMDGEQIKQKMLEYNRDQRILVDQLFKAGVFTTNIIE